MKATDLSARAGETSWYLRVSSTASARAEKSIAFVDQYRSYVINYGLGLDYVRTYVESFGEAPERRWAAMASLLSGPTLPSDLVVP